MTSLRVLLLVTILILTGCAGGPPAAGDGTTTTRATTTDREQPTVETTSPRSTATTTPPAATPTTTTAPPAPDLTPTEDCGSPDTTLSVPAVGENGSPGVAVEEVTASPGETVNVSVTARNVGEMHVRFQDGPALAASAAGWIDFAPSFDRAYPTVEPYWAWDSVEPEVTGTVPVRVADGVQPGTYCDASLVVWNDTDHDHDGGARARFVVHVSNGTDDR